MSRLFIVFTLIVLVAGCGQQPENKNVLARVGDAELTEQEARSAIDTTSVSFDAQVKNYVATWIRTEMLYQEAVRRGVENSGMFQKQLYDVRKQLAVQQLLEQLILEDTTTISSQELEKYFTRHADEFIVREEVMKLNLIGFSSRERASSFAAQLARGSSWEKAIGKVMDDSVAVADVVIATSNEYYSQRSVLYPELWKVAQTLGVNDVSFPVRTQSGYVIVQMVSNIKKGSAPVYELVQDEVNARFMREKRQLQIDSLIGTLRSRTAVEMMLPTVQKSDTNQNEIHD